ncbi:hypothetical protein [Streptomyces sp. NPDC002599]|uniref:hypothetical protein n=1 Tax=Streptomyces sp. NPDC002599 TaxID=3154421 RepID=UPI00331DF636
MPSCDPGSAGIGLGPLEVAVGHERRRSDAQLQDEAVKSGVRLLVDGRSGLTPARCTQTE